MDRHPVPDLPADWRDGIVAMRGYLDELRDTLRELSTGRYEGVDPSGRCRVHVDGTGLLLTVEFAVGATRLDGAEVAALVLAAVSAADTTRAETMAARLADVTNRISRSRPTTQVPR